MTAEAWIALATLVITLGTFIWTMLQQHYAELDGLYADLVACRPELEAIDAAYVQGTSVDPGALRTLRERAVYEAYALRIWNFLETIYDRRPLHRRVLELGRGQIDPTWLPIFDLECRLHSGWYFMGSSRGKFKDAFHDAVPKLAPRDWAAGAVRGDLRQTG